MTVTPRTVANLEPGKFNRELVEPDLPDHTQLPESDGTFVKNFQEHPQSILLTDSLAPILERLHPDGNYAIGQDSGIYWRSTSPPEKGAEAPDWFYVPNVPPLLDGDYRRSYVLAREQEVPAVIIEFASGDGSQERDKTPLMATESGLVTKPGKFWVYEQVIRAPYYGIYEVQTSKLEVYRLETLVTDGKPSTLRYRKLQPNAQERYPIAPLKVELGVWEGSYQNTVMKWMRWWDEQGQLLLTGIERADKAEGALYQEVRGRLEAEAQRQQEAQARLQAEAQRRREAQVRLQAEQERLEAEAERKREAQARLEAEQARLEAEQAQLNAIPQLQQMGMAPKQIAAVLSLPMELVLQAIREC